jgi:hypothetical protein
MNKPKEISPPSPRDFLVLMNGETKQAEILQIADIGPERILAQGADGVRSIPYVDTTLFNGPDGRIFVTNASDKYVQETKHLAQVEMSTIIREAVQYQRPGAAVERDPLWMKIFPWVAVVIVIILWLVKK